MCLFVDMRDVGLIAQSRLRELGRPAAADTTQAAPAPAQAAAALAPATGPTDGGAEELRAMFDQMMAEPSDFVMDDTNEEVAHMMAAFRATMGQRGPSASRSW